MGPPPATTTTATIATTTTTIVTIAILDIINNNNSSNNLLQHIIVMLVIIMHHPRTVGHNQPTCYHHRMEVVPLDHVLVQDGVVDQQQTVMVVIKPHPLTVRQQRQLRIQVVQVVNMQMNCLNLLVWDLMIEIKTLRCYRNIKEIYKQLLLNCCRR